MVGGPLPFKNRHLLGFCGERGRNRTYNLLIKSQLLCQLSYAPRPGSPGQHRVP